MPKSCEKNGNNLDEDMKDFDELLTPSEEWQIEQLKKEQELFEVRMDIQQKFGASVKEYEDGSSTEEDEVFLKKENVPRILNFNK